MVKSCHTVMDGLEEPQIARVEAPKPFKHQVGGNTAFFTLPNGHLLKPCDERELLFYRKMPRALLPIAPRCCSIIQNRHSSSTPHCCTTCHGQHETNLALTDLVRPHNTEAKRRTISRNFLVMSDLTREFDRPCVLDLKLGTRQHRDDAPPEKVVSQSLKCASTTSAEMGIRLCGMQYWTNDSENIYLNKMEGRRLDSDSLEDVLADFFSSTRSTQIVLAEVKKIKKVLSSLDGVRLFGASLLIVVESAGSKAEVRLVDFANATLPGLLGDDSYEGPDEGSIKGLSTLESLLEAL